MEALHCLDPEVANDKYASICLDNVRSVSISPFQAHCKAQFLETPCLIRYLSLYLLGFLVSKNPAFLKQLLKSLASQCVLPGLGRQFLLLWPLEDSQVLLPADSTEKPEHSLWQRCGSLGT